MVEPTRKQTLWFQFSTVNLRVKVKKMKRLHMQLIIHLRGANTYDLRLYNNSFQRKRGALAPFSSYAERSNTPLVSKYLSSLTFFYNFNHSSYSKNYAVLSILFVTCFTIVGILSWIYFINYFLLLVFLSIFLLWFVTVRCYGQNKYSNKKFES
jgi:hypothetical protein